MLFKERFLGIYVGLGMLLVLPYFGLALLWNHTPARTAARVAVIESQLGPTTLRPLEAEAEKEIAREGRAQGLTVVAQDLVQVKHPSSSEIDLFFRIRTAEQGGQNLEVVFRKGVFQLTAIDVSA